jgi:Na+:H+ antiporter, NhaA family
MKASKLFKEFFESEKAGGIVLVFCTAFSMILANSGFRDSYLGFWNIHIARHQLSHWINDGLMAIFFLLIGLELEREIYKGELSNIKNALLPMAGAVGGMLFPAAIFLFFNWGSDTQAGAGIPMATDIAFALGILSLLGNKVPVSLKIFLTALAVIDDLGAIVVIAIFYTKSIAWVYLLLSLGIWVLLRFLNQLKVYQLLPYLIGGIAMWYCMLHSGVHAAVTGVLLAFAIPFGNAGEKSPSYLLQHWLHKPVAFIILPLFALANTAVIINPGWQHSLTSPLGTGILTGLVLGKPIGIMLISFIAVKTGICRLPPYIKWKHILGTGLLAGIGFTMSIFITLLAFENETVINNAKFLILIASLISGLIGFLWLQATLKNNPAK